MYMFCGSDKSELNGGSPVHYSYLNFNQLNPQKTLSLAVNATRAADGSWVGTEVNTNPERRDYMCSWCKTKAKWTHVIS